MESMNHLFTDFDAVLFDLDGTLVETNIDFPLMKREMLNLATSCGVSVSQLAGLDILAIVDRMAHHIRFKEGAPAADNARRRALSILQEIELRHSKDAKEIPPARELIDYLKCQNIKVGIVTRNCRAASEDSLVRTGLHPDVLIAREDVGRAKPAPDQLRMALQYLDVEPERAVMIGDHPMDVAAGNAAGMRTIGLLPAGKEDNYYASVNPDAIARDLREILSAVIDNHR
jgi:phosphoglycolate phosphatase